MLVEIDIKKGLFEDMAIVNGDNVHLHILDYSDISFRFIRCQFYGQLVKDYPKQIGKCVWYKKQLLGPTEVSQSAQLCKFIAWEKGREKDGIFGCKHL